MGVNRKQSNQTAKNQKRKDRITGRSANLIFLDKIENQLFSGLSEMTLPSKLKTKLMLPTF